MMSSDLDVIYIRCVQKSDFMISETAPGLASPSLCPPTTSRHHIHILLLFSAPLPIHSGSACNPFIVAEVFATDNVPAQA